MNNNQILVKEQFGFRHSSSTDIATYKLAKNILTALTLNLPTTTIVTQPFNVIIWQLKFNPAA
jgi:hypothetical protein